MRQNLQSVSREQVDMRKLIDGFLWLLNEVISTIFIIVLFAGIILAIGALIAGFVVIVAHAPAELQVVVGVFFSCAAYLLWYDKYKKRKERTKRVH